MYELAVFILCIGGCYLQAKWYEKNQEKNHAHRH